MDKVSLYRQVYQTFKKLCEHGEQPCSFNQYCRQHGVLSCSMPWVLKDEYQNIKTLPYYTYRRDTQTAKAYMKIYEEFKRLCSEGNQPGTFKDFCMEHGVTRGQMHGFMCRNHLRLVDIPGYSGPSVMSYRTRVRSAKVPFENIIFEEAGFISAANSNRIIVKVDDHIVASFPANTHIDVIVKFMVKLRKEGFNVES